MSDAPTPPFDDAVEVPETTVTTETFDLGWDWLGVTLQAIQALALIVIAVALVARL